MVFLQRHLFFIVCGLATCAGVALAITGFAGMPAVLKEMELAEVLYRDLGTLATKPVNDAAIRAEADRIERVLADSEEVLAKAETLRRYTPLVEGVFPEGDTDARFAFVKAYEAAMEALLVSLRSGSPATPQDVEVMREKIDMEKLRRQNLGAGHASMMDQASGGPTKTVAGVLTRIGAKEDPEARASLAKAQSIYCYTTPAAAPTAKPTRAKTVPSLYYNASVRDVGSFEPPLLEDIWWAQIQYWIQKDVVDAIVAVNEDAAKAARERGEDRWVGTMPVKEVISIRFSEGYIEDDDDTYVGAAADGPGEAIPCGTRNMVFTGSMSGPSYDVVQFTVKLIMDQRDVLGFVERLTKNSFHTLLRVAYTAVPPNRRMVGKIYGSEPVINVVLDFETIMLPRVFHPLMPQVICDAYDHITCPPRDEEESED